MLSNVVGTLLAFVAIMLLLSLLVTSLVQFTQATLRLRARNLLVGVAALLKKQNLQATSSSAKQSSLRSDRHLALAAHVLNAVDASPKSLAEPNATTRILLGPPISWVKSGDLAQAVIDSVPAESAVTHTSSGAQATAVSAAAVQQTFENMEPALSKRFSFIIRVWTVAWSFLIAFSFQLSATQLLRELPATNAKREAILAAIPSLTNETIRKLAFSSNSVFEESIKRLTEKFPEYKVVFAEVSAESEAKAVMMAEMRSVLGSRPNRDGVLAEYSAIIDSLSQTPAQAAYANSSQMLEQLDSFGIAPKLDNFEFYASVESGKTGTPRIHWNNVVGVLITGILLSLGAPFWYEQLKNISSLRDAMNPSAASVGKP